MKIFTFILVLLDTLSYSQNYQWAITDTSQKTYCVAKFIDDSNNLIIATHNSSGIEIKKYNENHSIVWNQKIQAGWINDETVCSDHFGNVYLSGTVWGAFSIDGISFSGSGMFVVKFASSGSFQWAKKATGNGSLGLQVGADDHGNVYVAGNNNGDSQFDSVRVSSPCVINYLVKYNSLGKLMWLKQTKGSGFAGRGVTLKTDKVGTSYLVNGFCYTAHFDSLTVTSDSNGFRDIFIAKIDSSGRWLWVKSGGGMYDDINANLTLDKYENIYITGYTESPSLKFGNIHLSNPYSGDEYYIAKYDSSGKVQYAVVGGGPGVHSGSNICANSHGDTYITTDKFMNKFDKNGKLLWSKNQPNASNYGMIADTADRIYIIGIFQGTVNFDSYTLVCNPSNSTQMFIAELNDPSIIADISKSTIPANNFSIFPNPSTRIITITSTSPLSGEEYVIRVINSEGKITYSENLGLHSTVFTKELDLGYLPKGSYYVQMLPKNGRQDQKISKKLILL